MVLLYPFLGKSMIPMNNATVKKIKSTKTPGPEKGGEHGQPLPGHRQNEADRPQARLQPVDLRQGRF